MTFFHSLVGQRRPVISPGNLSPHLARDIGLPDWGEPRTCHCNRFVIGG